MKHWMAVLGMVALAGCATQKRVLPDAAYQEVAVGWVATHQCGLLGYVDAETAARGQTYLYSAMSDHVIDADRFNAMVKQVEPSVMSNLFQVCKEWEITIARRRQQIENNNAMVQEDIRQTNQAIQSIQNSRPIYCNTINGMTMCN